MTLLEVLNNNGGIPAIIIAIASLVSAVAGVMNQIGICRNRRFGMGTRAIAVTGQAIAVENRALAVQNAVAISEVHADVKNGYTAAIETAACVAADKVVATAKEAAEVLANKNGK